MSNMDYLLAVLFTALAAAFLLSLLNKWGILEWMQVHSPCDWINELLGCHFCCSFWMNVCLAAVCLMATGDVRALFIPVFATPLTVRLW